MEKRVSRMIMKPEEVDYFLSVKEEDITTGFIMETFGDFGKGPRFNPYDLITVPVGAYGGKIPNGQEKRNKNAFVTGVGRLIFNKFLFESTPELLDAIGYVDEDVGKKVYKRITKMLDYLMLEGEVPQEVYKMYCKKTQKLMPYVSILAPNHSDNMLTISAKINKRKEKLLKENIEALATGDDNAAKVFDKISQELLEYSRELMKDDPAMDMFLSGAGGDYDNNFKNIFIMRGSVKDPTPNKGYNLISSNYIDGVSKEEYSAMANTLSAGPYARSKKTELGGYWEKLFMSAFQHITLLEEGSDCGTDRHITVNVTDDNIDSIMYSYVINGKQLIEITSKNRNQFIGKKVKLRFASMCKAKDGHICNKCAGNLFYRLGIKNVGAATPQLPSKLKVLSMKLFHDDQLVYTEMDPMKAFLPDD